ncbi:hypothetical protein SNE40_013228 [Patella caerulea]|uniref:Sushi domain-containing protein n=1 Tax=Patella caerulea TaxID=87958 RepID=A0AAN8PNN2_PATCE
MIRGRFLCLIVCVSFVSIAGQTSQSTPSVDNSTSLSQTTDTLSNNSSNVAPSSPTANSSTSTPGNSSILATSDAQNIPPTTTLSTGSLMTQADVTTRRAMLTTTTTSVLIAPVNDMSQPQLNVQQPQAQSNNTPNTAGLQPVDNISSNIPTPSDLQPEAQSQTAPTGSLGDFGMTMTCSTPVDIPGASYRIFGAFAVYQCRPGYLTARYVSMCLPDSTWLPPNITCKPKDCGNKIPVVDGATSTYDKTIFGSSVMYRCKEMDGYHYESGTTTVTCGADGLWSDINLKCALNTYRPMTQTSQQIPQTSIMPSTENSLMRNLALFVSTAESALSANNKMSAFELLSAFKALLSGQSGISVPVAPTSMPTSFPSLDQQSSGSFPGIQQQFPTQSRFFTNAPPQFFSQQPQFPQPNYQNYQQQQQQPQQQNQPQQQPFRNPFQQQSNQFPYNPFPYNPNNYQQYPSQQFQQQQYPQQYNPRPMNPYPQQPGMNMFPQQQPTGNTFQQQPTQRPVRNAQLPTDTKSQTNEQQPKSQQQNNQVPVQAQQQPVQAQQQPVQAPRQPIQTPQQPIQTPQQPVQTPQQPAQNPQATQPSVNNVSQQLQSANNLLVQQPTFANTSPQVPNQSQPQSSSVQNQSPQQQPTNTILQQPNQLSQQTPQQTNIALPQQPQQQPQSTNNVFSQNLPQPNRFVPNDPRPQNQLTQQNTVPKQPQQTTQPQTNVFSQNMPTQPQTNVFSQNLPNQQPIRNTMLQQNPQQQQQPLQNTQQQLQQNPQQQRQAQPSSQQPQQSTISFKPQQQQQQQQTMGQFPQNLNTNTAPQANQPGNRPTQVSRAEMENALRGILGNGGYNSMSPQLKKVLLGPMPVTNTAPTNQQVKTPAQTQPAVTDPYMAMLASATGAQSLNNNMNMNNMFGFGGQPSNNMSDPFAALGLGTGMGLGGAPGMMNNLMMDPEMVAEMNEQRMAGGGMGAAGLPGGMAGALSGALGGAGNKPGTNPLAAMFGSTLPGFGVMDPQGTMQGAGTGNPFDAMMTGGHPAAGSMKPGQPGAQDTALMALLNGMAPGQGQNLAGGTALGIQQPTSPVTGADPSATKPAQQAQTLASPKQAQSPVQPAQSASSDIGTNPGVNPAAAATAATNGLNAETMQMMRSLGLVKK